jgi:uncharacterized protein
MPERPYVFLDANVIFSASYKPNSKFLAFWNTPNVLIMTSLYAAEEVRRNCETQEQSHRLEALLEQTTIVSDSYYSVLPRNIVLPEKDRPILSSAIDAGATYLVTGDRKHFGSLMNRPIKTRHGSLIIVEPRSFLNLLKKLR